MEELLLALTVSFAPFAPIGIEKSPSTNKKECSGSKTRPSGKSSKEKSKWKQTVAAVNRFFKLYYYRIPCPPMVG
uniref:Secreted protein n=1 Tax=Steinernema glaseri TaxID=37863 RepID=A0A1I7ZDT6_9BILA